MAQAQPDTPEQADARLDQLEGWQNWVQEHLVPRIDELETELSERETYIEELEARIEDLETQLEMLDGLADDQASTPEKRAIDLARAMIRQAKTRADGRITKYYKEVKEDLATLGHEGLHDPQAFTAMEDVSEATGFGMTKVNRDGKQVKAVGLNLDELEGDAFVNEIKNGKGDGDASETTENDTTDT
jgi:cob(I)alamin adenosyltransferase